jgi:hypothetical protein
VRRARLPPPLGDVAPWGRRRPPAAQAGKLDAVVVWKPDRFGRSALDVLANMLEMAEHPASYLRALVASGQVASLDVGDIGGARAALQAAGRTREPERNGQ